MSQTKEKTILINEKGIRHDNRKKNDLRTIDFKIGVLDRADGSALITWGRNKILAAVYGPRELHPKHMALPDRALVRCEYRMATFSVPERKSAAPKRREREISKILGEAVEPALFDYLYPRSVVDIFIQVLQADGGSRCASITAAALALADAGVPMRDLITGCAAGNLDGHVVLDLDDIEDKEGNGDLPLAYMPNLNQIVLLQSDGEFTPDQYNEALDMLIPACKKIYTMMREALSNKYSRITAEVTETLTTDTTQTETITTDTTKEPIIESEEKEPVIESIPELSDTSKEKDAKEEKDAKKKDKKGKEKSSRKDKKASKEKNND